MPRHDLLTLTTDDLVLLANRGLVKRAQAEMQTSELTAEIEEDADGALILRWSDGVTCTLPANAPLAHARCTCPATGICRHLVRSVLLYQERAPVEPDGAGEPELAVWDPGTISDDELKAHLSRARLTAARRLFDGGQVIELARSRRPVAQFHSLGTMLRFLVPGDVRYTRCECAEEAPCSHVPLAVWAFRQLDPSALGGIVTTSTVEAAVPHDLLEQVETALRDIVVAGFSDLPRPLLDRLRRFEAACRKEGLIWPGDILADLVQLAEAYAAQDARFMPERVVELLGEWCMRSDALQAGNGAVPRLFICGTPSDRTTDIGFARLIGLGCDVRVRRGGVELIALLQDSGSGAVVSVSRAFADPPGEPASQRRSFAQLAQTLPIKDSSFAAIGAGQVLTRGGKRTSAGAFTPGRASFSINSQGYAWETLRAPLLVEDFAELTARNAASAPHGLRPRRSGEDVVVCPVASVEHVTFDAARQELLATLRDQNGDLATLAHPYTARGQSGFEALFARLRDQPHDIRFVCAHSRPGAHGPLLAPIGLVFESGGVRTLCQPWIDQQMEAADASGGSVADSALPIDILAHYQQQVLAALTELCLLGLHTADDQVQRTWAELAHQGHRLGFSRTADVVQHLAAALLARQRTLHWDEEAAAVIVLELIVLFNLMREITWDGPSATS